MNASEHGVSGWEDIDRDDSDILLKSAINDFKLIASGLNPEGGGELTREQLMFIAECAVKIYEGDA